MDNVFRHHEQSRDTARKATARQCSNIQDLIIFFRSVISNGPVFFAVHAINCFIAQCPESRQPTIIQSLNNRQCVTSYVKSR